MVILGALFVVCSSMSFYAIVHDQQKHEIAERARRDALTGLFNRRAFFEAAQAWERQGAAYAILMVDIDHFKSINDTYGHLIGGLFRAGGLACRYGRRSFAYCYATAGWTKPADWGRGW